MVDAQDWHGGREGRWTYGLPYLVGYKSPDGNLGYLKMNSDHEIDLIAIDNTLKKIAVDDLQLSIIECSYVLVLQKQDDGTYVYVFGREGKHGPYGDHRHYRGWIEIHASHRQAGELPHRIA